MVKEAKKAAAVERPIWRPEVPRRVLLQNIASIKEEEMRMQQAEDDMYGGGFAIRKGAQRH